MFKKNSRITFEILPDGKVLVETYLHSNVNPDQFSSMINNLLCRNYIQNIAESILKSNNNSQLVNEICEKIFETQKNIKLVPISNSKRNPLIKPSQVFSEYQGE